jgi:hypothetical protein
LNNRVCFPEKVKLNPTKGHTVGTSRNFKKDEYKANLK